jgi:hypothetical protein
VRSCGVSVRRASSHGANAETIQREQRDDFARSAASRHVVHGQGILADRNGTPRAGDSMRRAHRVEQRRILAGKPAAAIQFADSFTRPRSETAAAARFVSASPTAIRPDAGASMTASGVRSPIANASPAWPTKSISVTAQSATGTCHGPTSGRRLIRPGPVPMPTRKVLPRRGRAQRPQHASFSSIAGASGVARLT